MAGRREGERPLIVERPDHGALFVQAARRIVLSSGILEAYRRSSGLLMEVNRTQVAQETLALEISRSAFGFNGIGLVSDAHEHAGRWAMKCFLGNWWTCTVTDIPPAKLGPGDEFFSRRTVSAIIEKYRDFTPDLKG